MKEKIASMRLLVPRNVPRIENEIHEVFLSATAKDLLSYRVEIRNALHLIEVEAFLQEEWAEGAMEVVDMCLKRLAESDAYIGVFGFRYGWIPAGRDRSITELECDHAFGLWGQLPSPPIFCFVPEAGSVAAKELEEEADNTLAKDHPGEETKRLESRDRQRKFCEGLRNSGRFVAFFRDVGDLKARVMASISNWNLKIIKNASCERKLASKEIPLAILGEIDRALQRHAIEDALVALNEGKLPGMCILVHGEQDAGQQAFLSFLDDWEVWETNSPPIRITPPYDTFDIGSLRNAALAALAGGGRESDARSLDSLAKALLERCSEASQVLMLGGFERLQGGLDAFHQGFWKPLLAAIRERQAGNAPTHRFVLLAALQNPLSDVPPPCVWSYTEGGEFVETDLLIALPELGPFSKKEVSDWLNSQFDLDLASRTALAKEAVANDGRPAKVFDRLNARNFWSSMTPKGTR